jgi:NAD(P)-binding Rossmann-like domain
MHTPNAQPAATCCRGRVDDRRGPEEPCRGGRKGLSVTRVAIVGAGIGGLAAALALRKCDVDIVVLEQADHVGVGIQLTPNAIQVRTRLGVLDAIVDAASSRNHWTSSRADGATRCCQPAGRADDADDADAGVPVAVGNLVANDPDPQGILIVAALFGRMDRVCGGRERASGARRPAGLGVPKRSPVLPEANLLPGRGASRFAVSLPS